MVLQGAWNSTVRLSFDCFYFFSFAITEALRFFVLRRSIIYLRRCLRIKLEILGAQHTRSTDALRLYLFILRSFLGFGLGHSVFFGAMPYSLVFVALSMPSFYLLQLPWLPSICLVLGVAPFGPPCRMAVFCTQRLSSQLISGFPYLGALSFPFLLFAALCRSLSFPLQ